MLIANTRAGFEHVDRVLQSWEVLGYIKPEAKEALKEQILSGWQDPQRIQASQAEAYDFSKAFVW